MKKKMYIIMNCIGLLILAGIIAVVFLINNDSKSEKGKDKEQDITKQEVTTTATIFYNEDGSIYGTGYIDDNGDVVIESYAEIAKVECTLKDNSSDDYDYEEYYYFEYGNDNTFYDVKHKHTYKYKEYLVEDENGMSMKYENEEAKKLTNNEYIEIKEYDNTEIYNPDHQQFKSLDEYLVVLEKHFNKCEKIQ